MIKIQTQLLEDQTMNNDLTFNTTGEFMTLHYLRDLTPAEDTFHTMKTVLG